MAQQERARITRKRVLDGAAHVFARTGYDGASLSEITTAAGMSKGALYFHFSSKAQVARAIVDYEQEVAKRSAERVIAEADGPLEAVMGLCADFVRLVSTDALVCAGVRLTVEADRFEPPLTAPFDDWMQAIAELFQAAISAGQLRSDVDVTALARFVIPAFTGVQLVSGILTEYVDVLPRLRDMWWFLLPGITTPGSLPDAIAALDRILPQQP